MSDRIPHAPNLAPSTAPDTRKLAAELEAARALENPLRMTRAGVEHLIEQHGEIAAHQMIAAASMRALRSVKLVTESGHAGQRARLVRAEAGGRVLAERAAPTQADETRARAIADARAFVRGIGGLQSEQWLRAANTLADAGLDPREVHALIGDYDHPIVISKYDLRDLVAAARRGWRPNVPDEPKPEPFIPEPVPTERTSHRGRVRPRKR